ncbi:MULTISPECIES: hypothetical protein [Gordonia]|uniref:hypothetical protein n=1 Tax=Gordonia oleivorans TaxID=3156618 RepID=UPI0032B31054
MTDPNNPQQPGAGEPYGQGQPYQGGQPFGANQPYGGGQPYPQQPYAGQGYPPPQPPKKRKIWPWILLAVVIVIIAFVGGCVALIGGAAESIDNESNRTVTVTYEVTGEGQASSVTYTTNDVNVSQDTNAALPWTKDVQISGLGKFVSLTATNDFDASGSITCTIKQGEKVISTNTSSGPAATASCSGTAD